MNEHPTYDTIAEAEDFVILRRRDRQPTHLRQWSDMHLLDRDDYNALIRQAALGLAVEERAREIAGSVENGQELT